MQRGQLAFLLSAATFTGCVAASGASDVQPPLTPARAAEVEAGVREFMATVSRDVTQEGPVAWQKLFADTPAFFMASDGQLAFSSGAAARAAIPAVVRNIHSITLQWGTDLRVDPLTPNLAVVGASFHESRIEGAGQHVEENGFFTGTVELEAGRWRFRNAHWSDPRPSVP